MENQKYHDCENLFILYLVNHEKKVLYNVLSLKQAKIYLFVKYGKIIYLYVATKYIRNLSHLFIYIFYLIINRNLLIDKINLLLL